MSDSLARVRPIFITACLSAFLLAPVASSAPAPRREPGIEFNYMNADISQIIRDVGEAVGQIFVHGDEVRGRITLVVPGRVTSDEAVELLNAMLYMKGFASLPVSPGVRNIVPVLGARSGAPFAIGKPDAEGEGWVATLRRLRFAAAQDVARALEPYVASVGGIGLAYPPSNSLILIGTEAQLSRLIAIARAIDEASDQTLLARTIRYRSAEEIANMVDEVFNSSLLDIERVELWTDDRINMLLARGSPDLLDEIRDFISDADRPIEGHGQIRVLRVLNREVEDVAKVLTTLTSGEVVGETPSGEDLEEAAEFGADLAGRSLSVSVDRATRSLVLQSDPETLEIVSDVVARLDILPPRIAVEVLVLEMQRPARYAFGINFFAPLLTPKTPDDLLIVAQSPQGLPLSSLESESKLKARFTRQPLVFPLEDLQGVPVGVVPTDAVSVSVEADDSVVQSHILLNPHLVVVSGEEHQLFSGNNVPIPVASTPLEPIQNPDGTTSPAPVPLATTRQTIQRQDVGVGLRVRPTLGEEGVVALDLDIEYSEITPSIAGSVEQVGPSIAKRQIEVKANLRGGEYVVIGQQVDRATRTGRIGVPFLMNLPVLGQLFSTTTKESVDTEIFIVVSAHALRSLDDDLAETIRRRLAFQRALARVNDLTRLSDAPYAVLLDTLVNEAQAHDIAQAFAEDGFTTRVTRWDQNGRLYYDTYITDLTTFADAAGLANRLREAGWPAQLTVVPEVNEFAGE